MTDDRKSSTPRPRACRSRRSRSPAGEDLGITEDEVIETLKRLIARRRCGGFRPRSAPAHRLQPQRMLIARSGTRPPGSRSARPRRSSMRSATATNGRTRTAGRTRSTSWSTAASSTVDTAVERVRALPGIERLEVLKSAGELKKTSLSG